MTKEEYNERLKILRKLMNSGVSNPNTLLKASFLTEKDVRINLSHEQNILWGYKCANSVLWIVRNKEMYDRAKYCLSLVDMWLKGELRGIEEIRKLQRVANFIHDNASKKIEIINERACLLSIGYSAYTVYGAIYSANAAFFATQAAPSAPTQREKNLTFLIESALTQI